MTAADREPTGLGMLRVALLVMAFLITAGGLLTAGVLFDHTLYVAAGIVLGAALGQAVIIAAVGAIAGAVDEVRAAVLPKLPRTVTPAKAGPSGEPFGLYGRKG